MEIKKGLPEGPGIWWIKNCDDGWNIAGIWEVDGSAFVRLLGSSAKYTYAEFREVMDNTLRYTNLEEFHYAGPIPLPDKDDA